MFQMPLTGKKLDYIFGKLFGNFFSLSLWLPRENRAKLKKLVNLKSRLEWEAQYPRYSKCTDYFLISKCSDTSYFWSEDNFCFISDCRNSMNCKLEKAHDEQIIIFYSPSNAFCSSGESAWIKHFKRHTFIGICSLFNWFNPQILIFC